MPRDKRSGAFHRWGAVNRQLRASFYRRDGDFALLKALKEAILATKPPESGECRLKKNKQQRSLSYRRYA